jgi:hypothetical protein
LNQFGGLLKNNETFVFGGSHPSSSTSSSGSFDLESVSSLLGSKPKDEVEA